MECLETHRIPPPDYEPCMVGALGARERNVVEGAGDEMFDEAHDPREERISPWGLR
jgi:hypothetical protein